MPCQKGMQWLISMTVTISSSKGEFGAMIGIFKLYPHIKILKKIVYHLFQFVSSKKISVTTNTHSLPLGMYAKQHTWMLNLNFLYVGSVRLSTLRKHRVPALEVRVTFTKIALTAISQLGNCRINCKKVLAR